MSDYLRTVVAVVPAVLVGQLVVQHTALGGWHRFALVVGLAACLGYLLDRRATDGE